MPAAPARVGPNSDAPLKATSHRLYQYLLARVDKWLESGWATPEQRRALAAWVVAGLEDGE